MSCPLPETLTPDFQSLTPTTMSIIQSTPNYWGRLLSTIRTIPHYDLEKSSFTLGRNPETCSVVLVQDNFPPSITVERISKEHFKIKMYGDGTVRIHDLSRNGTYLNGQLIGKDKECILQSGDRIAIYSKKLTIYRFISFQNLNQDYLPEELRQKYVVSEKLGHGACGEVRLVYEKYTCQPYACKRILKSTSLNNALNRAENIQKEISILKKLNHPFLISVKEIEETSKSFFIIMEYMEGGVLTNIITPRQLTESQVKYHFYQIVIAVQHLHNMNIIHRDLKPDNILLKNEDRDNNMIKISDFGLSKILSNQSLMNTKCGTPYYSAPEINDTTISSYCKKVDVWSLGVILYYMLSQELPFRYPVKLSPKKHQLYLRKMIISGNYSLSNPIWKNLSDNVKDLIKNMLVCDAKKRFSIDQVAKHPWFQNEKMIRKINDLVFRNYQTASIKSEIDLEDSNDSKDSNDSEESSQPKRIKLSQEDIETLID